VKTGTNNIYIIIICVPLIDAAPVGPNLACHPSGGIQTDTFNKWFDYFVHWLKMSAQEPVLLTADGHIHTPKNKDVTDTATEHGVAIINLPSHPTQKNSATRRWFHGVLPNILRTRD